MRILIPAFAFTAIAIAIRDGGNLLLVGATVAVIGGAFLYAIERGGVYATDAGISYVPTVSGRGARWSWAEIDRFVVDQPAALMTVLIVLKDGTRQPLLPTKGWAFQHHEVESLCAQLNAELDRSHAGIEPAARKTIGSD
jgi:hypothetical protein